jgi:hypothetical protein
MKEVAGTALSAYIALMSQNVEFFIAIAVGSPNQAYLYNE